MQIRKDYGVAMTTPLHVVLGAGQIGPRVASLLHARGLRVRLVRRGAFTGVPPGIETVRADVGDPAAATAAMAGAAVVYGCVNPPYHEWATELPRLTTAILAGAAAAGARLVALDNLYMYGDTHAMNEDTPVAPTTRKGELRARAAAQLLDAHRAGTVPVAIGRASDFFGPGAINAHFGDRFYRRIFAGKPGECLGDPDSLHSYSYVGDVAAGLVTLGLDPRGDGQAWMLPTPPAESTRAVANRLGAALGRDVRVTRLPGWALTALGVFSKPMRELGEMTYQWLQPFVIDDRRFRATFGATATGWDDAIAATAAWARETYGVARAA
jgi:nucleoside-diphosphate-sugar epimerase